MEEPQGKGRYICMAFLKGAACLVLSRHPIELAVPGSVQKGRAVQSISLTAQED